MLSRAFLAELCINCKTIPIHFSFGTTLTVFEIKIRSSEFCYLKWLISKIINYAHNYKIIIYQKLYLPCFFTSVIFLVVLSDKLHLSQPLPTLPDNGNFGGCCCQVVTVIIVVIVACITFCFVLLLFIDYCCCLSRSTAAVSC